MPKLYFAKTEKNGKTLHLLKSKSKPTPSGRQRKKVSVLGSFGEYSESKKKAQSEANAPAPNQMPNLNSGAPSILQFMAPGPNSNPPAPKGKDAKM